MQEEGSIEGRTTCENLRADPSNMSQKSAFHVNFSKVLVQSIPFSQRKVSKWWTLRKVGWLLHFSTSILSALPAWVLPPLWNFLIYPYPDCEISYLCNSVSTNALFYTFSNLYIHPQSFPQEIASIFEKWALHIISQKCAFRNVIWNNPH